jgi:outer membrane protein assembly factor BamB
LLPRRDQPDRKLLSGDPVGSGIAVANGVSYFTTMMTKKLVALDAQTGKLLFERELDPVWSGPALSRGRVFVGTGSIFWQFDTEVFAVPPAFDFPAEPNGAVYSFGLPGEDELDRLPEVERPASGG